MLVRSAGRRQRRQTARLLAAAFDQLTLPWLAPAQLRWNATHSSASNHSISKTRPRRRSSTSRHIVPAQARQLATATDQYAPRYGSPYPPPGQSNTFRNPSQDAFLPWEITQMPKARLSSVRPKGSPIILNTNILNPEETIKVLNGVQGTAHDLLQHLHTALQVRRFDRAEAIIQRLGGIFSRDSAELLHAHTVYLEAQLSVLASQNSKDDAAKILVDMQKWFEVEVKKAGVAIDGRMLVTLVRATTKALSGDRRDRTVKRYLEVARNLGEDVHDEVLESEEYDDDEFTLLGRLDYELLHPPAPELGTPAASDEPSELEKLAASELEKYLGTKRIRLPDTSVKPQTESVSQTEELPEVRPMEIRGGGLTGVKMSLQEFINTPSLPPTATAEEQHEHAMKRQRIMEKASVEVAMERWRRADEDLRKIGIHTSMQSKPMNALMWQWYQDLLPALKAELEQCKKLLNNPGKQDHDRYHYGPYLELLPLEKVAASTIIQTLGRLCGDRNKGKDSGLSVKIAALAQSLAKGIEEECIVSASKTKSASKRDLKLRALRRKGVRHGRLSKVEAKKQFEMSEFSWPLDTKVKFGAMLVSKLIETAQLPVTRMHPRTLQKITQMQPAFLHQLKWDEGKKTGTLTPNPALVEKLMSEPVASMLAKGMPMVVEPRPWNGWNQGGYLEYPNSIIRLHHDDKGAKQYFSAAHRKGDMTQIYEGLTTLGQVAWKIDKKVFGVMLEAWNSGEAIANLAPLHPKLEIPPEPEASADPGPRRKWLEEVRAVDHKRTGLHSERCFQNFQMEIARTMLDETLYFPHNMDFRGRAYPIPPYLNHMGADNVRGLLTFAKGKRLGATGLRWLKIHLATVAGYDKASIAERVEYVDQHLDDIYDSVRNPLNGQRWWLKADDAWQTLAACFELTAALDSSDPENFESHLPVQQDGTCNGLQHYAALGGDKIGAAQVNLEPGDRPADVYTAVAEAVKEEVHEDALAGNPVAQKLDGRITRKCVKRPVMTNVYGVTWYGAKEQVQQELETLFPEVRKSDAVTHAHMARYVATKIFKSLGTMFSGAQAIQHWLGQCADRISTSLTPEQFRQIAFPEERKSPAKAKAGRPKKVQSAFTKTDNDSRMQREAKTSFKSSVVWTTPLHLPVAQPYRADSRKRVETSLQQFTLHEPSQWNPVSKKKQLQGFPPNFIHSLDASHMLLSALRCKEMGVSFAAVHDSFWTHACDVDVMGRCLREAFVEMHGDDIIGRLREEFVERYKGHVYLASVLAESKVGQKIQALRKELALPRSKEAGLEAERMRLLASTDEAERKKGAEMRTPGAIVAEEHDEDAFAVPAEIESHTLGTIPEGEDGIASTNSDADDFDTLPSESVTAAAGEGVVGGSVLDTDIVATDATVIKDSPEGKKEKVAGKKRKACPKKIHVWMPLEFPDVPAKGDFDVRKVRASTYFFH